MAIIKFKRRDELENEIENLKDKDNKQHDTSCLKKIPREALEQKYMQLAEDNYKLGLENLNLEWKLDNRWWRFWEAKEPPE